MCVDSVIGTARLAQPVVIFGGFLITEEAYRPLADWIHQAPVLQCASFLRPNWIGWPPAGASVGLACLIASIPLCASFKTSRPQGESP
jgi:hypothetical protein